MVHPNPEIAKKFDDDLTNAILLAEKLMQFQCNFMYAMLFCKSHLLLPVRNQHFVPLVIQNFRKIFRPGGGTVPFPRKRYEDRPRQYGS